MRYEVGGKKYEEAEIYKSLLNSKFIIYNLNYRTSYFLLRISYFLLPTSYFVCLYSKGVQT